MCGCGVVAAETLILLVCYVKFQIPCYYIIIIIKKIKVPKNYWSSVMVSTVLCSDARPVISIVDRIR